MRYAITLAAIPAALWVAWPAPSPPIAPMAVATEGVRAQRMDDNTFRIRWSAVDALPPATVVREVPVRIEASARPPPARLVKRASLRGDVCARHGMRRVTVMRGRWQGWRCRR